VPRLFAQRDAEAGAGWHPHATACDFVSDAVEEGLIAGRLACSDYAAL